MKRIWLPAAALLLLLAACSKAPVERAVPQADIDAAASGITAYPAALDPACNDRAKVYDECSNQFGLYTTALERARAENKVVLVIVGAEWCLWCHILDAQLNGATGALDYINRHKRGDVSQDTLDLVNYLAANFVVAHIERDKATGADDVLAATGADKYYKNVYPTVFSVSPDGSFAAMFNDSYAEISKKGLRTYHGYNRRRLLEELKRLHAAAMPE